MESSKNYESYDMKGAARILGTSSRTYFLATKRLGNKTFGTKDFNYVDQGRFQSYRIK